MVDGGFYRKQANFLFGEKTPEERANELVEYCHRHLKETYIMYIAIGAKQEPGQL